MLPPKFSVDETWPEFQCVAMPEAITVGAAKGEATVDYGVEQFVAPLCDVQAFDLSRLALGPH
jgi:hypothetical protein